MCQELDRLYPRVASLWCETAKLPHFAQFDHSCHFDQAVVLFLYLFHHHCDCDSCSYERLVF